MNDMNTDRALSWDDEFTNEQQEFVLLPEGDYAFEVTGMERARFEGSAKLPPCSMAKLTLKIFGGAKGDTTVTDRLYLHTKTQGLLGAFFESIGQCKRGETAPAGTRWWVPGAGAVWASGNTPSRAAPTQVRPARSMRSPASCRRRNPRPHPLRAGRRGHSDGAGTETLPAAGP